MYRIQKSTILAWLLLPVFMLLHNFNELFGFIPFNRFLPFAFIVYSVMGVGWFLLKRFPLPVSKSSLILLLISFFTLFFTPIHNFFLQITFGSFLGSLFVFIPACILLIVYLVRRIIKAVSIPEKLNMLFNFTLVCLIIPEIILTFIHLNEYKKNRNLIYPGSPLSKDYKSSDIPDSNKPDIYFLIIDELTNNKTLKSVWKFNNDSTTDWLESKGFHMASDTHANYSFTLFSLSSTFNMNYLDSLKGADGTKRRSLMEAYHSLQDNEVFHILKKEKYSIQTICPIELYFEGLKGNQLGEHTLPGNIIYRMKKNLSIGKWSGIKNDQIPGEIQESYQILCNTIQEIKKTVDSSELRKPHFVYGHLFITHGPHMFDSTGSLMTKKLAGNISTFNSYTSQVRYADRVIRELSGYILQHNKRNTVIILQGDHGFRGFIHGPGWFDRTPDSLKKDFLPNFSAILYPDHNYKGIYDSMSPVNLFRIVFNKYFLQNFPMLKDSGILVKDDIEATN